MAKSEEIPEEDFNSQFLEDVESDEPTPEEPSEEAETVSVEPEEPIEEVEPEPTQDAVKAYREDQSKKDKRISALEKENSKYKQGMDELGGRLEKLETPEQDVLTKPVRPTKPHGYDATDASTDPESISWKYREAREKYIDDVEDYRDTVETNRQADIQADKNAKLRVEQSTKYANEQIASYQEQGLSHAEAVECFDWWFTKDESRSPEVLVSGWKNKTQGAPRPTPKKKIDSPLPPGVDGGITDQKTKTVDDAFYDDFVETEDRREL